MYLFLRFWKECCEQYVKQMLDNGCPLMALPYLNPGQNITQAIDVLCNKEYYREAWIVARLNLEKNDPTFVDILEKWISYMETNGNLDGAAMM